MTRRALLPAAIAVRLARAEPHARVESPQVIRSRYQKLAVGLNITLRVAVVLPGIVDIHKT
jgi:hypothetical protein